MKEIRKWLLCLYPIIGLVLGQHQTAASASAANTIWADSFETNASSRWAASSAGVWKILAPTAGPATNGQGYRTHSGTNCASTQGYGLSNDARLVCTNYGGASSLLIPAATEFPRLRFWQWFSLDNALNYVEISTNSGTNWISLSLTNLNLSSSGVWSQPSLDLTAFAGDSVQIAFHFASGCCYGNGLGWYVDDVAVTTGEAVLSFPEGFESDPKTSQWAVDAGTWEIGAPTGGPATNSAGYRTHTGTNCAGTGFSGNYAISVDSRLISPYFTVPTSGATLRFAQWCSFNNALGWVEVNNGTTTTTTTTTTTITTTTNLSLNTNIYELFNAEITGYTTPLYWNQTMHCWTNSTKSIGVGVYATGQFYFEAGNSPLTNANALNPDYVAETNPVPQSASATNFLALYGMVWEEPLNPYGGDNPVGYFATNSSVTFTTNTSTQVANSSWTQISPTYLDFNTDGIWTNTTLDLSTFEGQTVQVAFHFQSGPLTQYTAPGWFVDDVTLVALPEISSATNQFVIDYGQEFTTTLAATNAIGANYTYTFAPATANANAEVAADGLVTWTNTAAPPGSYTVGVKASDNNSPPFTATNNISVTVLPLSSQLVITNALTLNDRFKFGIKTPWTNKLWWLEASTNLDSATNWVPIYTNISGVSGLLLYTDQWATNSLQRYYRAVFP
jgi:hypothetical protein